MSTGQRIAGTLSLLGVGVFAWLFLGPAVTRCLGPLGRTLVDSIRDGCIDPTVGMGVPIGLLFVLAAVLLAFPARGPAVRASVFGAVLGGSVASATYLLARQTSLTGPTSTGEIITVPLPIDWAMALAAAIGGAGIGFVLVGRLLRRRPTLPA